jgi:hypothetical protein
MRKILVVLMVFGVACFAAEYQFSTGSWDQVPNLGGSHDGWGEWFITAFENDTGEDINIIELGMPCCGPASGDYGWVVWYDVGSLSAPSGPASTADAYGPYTPVDSNPSTFPPTTYTYVDLSGEDLTVEADTFFVIGYDVTGNGGQIDYNGYTTWAWYGGGWDPDPGYSRTALIQCLGETAGPPDTEPPYVTGMDPDDGEVGVPPDSNIVFECVDDLSKIDLATIDFTVRDTTLSSGRTLHSSGASLSVTFESTRTVAGYLDIDDSDPKDVVCTFDPTDDLNEGDTISCTVSAGLADTKGNEMADDFVWTFDTTGADVKTTTWGVIKAEF